MGYALVNSSLAGKILEVGFAMRVQPGRHDAEFLCNTSRNQGDQISREMEALGKVCREQFDGKEKHECAKTRREAVQLR